MIDNLIEYLSKRKIAPILHNSKEKDDLKALKLMSVIDYYTEQRLLYPKIQQQPKLLRQLMQFHSYSNFKYYDCQVNRAVGNRLLQCKFCELVGPYALVLTHMAINHNSHISTKTCAYCNRDNIVGHTRGGPLQDCYNTYLEMYGIQVERINAAIITEFYKLLKDISKSLGVIITRLDSFAGIGYARVEPIVRKIPNFPTKCTVFHPKNSNKEIDDIALDKSFQMVIEFVLGGNGLSRLTQNTTDDSDSILILSDDDDQDSVDNIQRKRTQAATTRNIVVKTERPDNVEVSTNHNPVVIFPEPVVMREPIVTQIRDETHGWTFPTQTAPSRNQQTQAQPAAMENNTPTTERSANTPQKENTSQQGNTSQQVNTSQQDNSAPPKSETNETHFKADPSADDFGRHVANRLSIIKNPIKRRKLELQIQQNIVQIEQEDFEENN